MSALINDPQKKWRASTRIHDPFSDNLKIWPTFIYRGEVPSNTFAKLPVCVLINDLKKLDPKSSLQLKTNHLVMWPTSTSRPKCFCTFLKLPVSALINDPQKKRDRHQLGPMTHFLTSSKFDPLLYIGEKCLATHLQSFLWVSYLMTPKYWTQNVHYSSKPIIWSCDLLPQVGHRILAHLQSFLCVL